MSNDNNTKAEIAMLATLAANHLRDYKVDSANFTIKNDAELFGLGAKLLYVGQALTEASNFKLEPATHEGRMIISRIVELLEMPTLSVNAFGKYITEPIEEGK